ncbi:Protein CBG24982, partial [Caenorhabditis briggsae]
QIDIAWIDIEGGEFEFLDQFYRGGPMDEKGIVICQFNLEVHSKFNPPGAQNSYVPGFRNSKIPGFQDSRVPGDGFEILRLAYIKNRSRTLKIHVRKKCYAY